MYTACMFDVKMAESQPSRRWQRSRKMDLRFVAMVSKTAGFVMAALGSRLDLPDLAAAGTIILLASWYLLDYHYRRGPNAH